MQHKENVTYQLVPGDDGDQHWLVRFMDGPYTETVIQYGAISINENGAGVMNFNFFVESSPDSELTSEDVGLQEWAGDVLQEILRQGTEDGSTQITDKEQ